VARLRVPGLGSGIALSVVLVIVGVLFILPMALLIGSPPLPAKDEATALNRFAEVPLREIGKRAVVEIKVPDSPAWRLIRARWGDPGLIVAAVSAENGQVYCFDELELDVQVVDGHGGVALGIGRGGLYGYTSQCNDNGRTFRAEPGGHLALRVVSRNPRLLPFGDLIVTSYWGSGTKDCIVDRMIHKDVAGPARVLALFGFLALACGAILYFRSSRGAGFRT
jgi:hypothetical protein